MAKLVVFLVVFVLLAPMSRADLQPLDIQAVSADLTIEVPGHTLIAVPGVGSASTGGVIDDPNQFVGSVNASVQVQQDRIDFVLNLTASEIFPLGATVEVHGDLVIDFNLPNLGGPVAPMYTDLANLVDQQVEIQAVDAGVRAAHTGDVFRYPESTTLGGYLHSASSYLSRYYSGYGEVYRLGNYRLFPEGDSIRLPLRFEVVADASSTTNVSLDFSFSLRFRTAAPSPFLGDLNADESIDIVDSTLLRRYLAGLPVP